MEPDEIAVEIIAGLLEARTGQKLTSDRRWRIGTALTGLLRERGISSSGELVAMLTHPNQSELAQQVVEALLNNETYFFRDQAIFMLLRREILPDLQKRRASTKRLTIWSAGCSTGQEVLSLAMIFAEMPGQWKDWTIDLRGTDVSSSAIEAARKGMYSQFQIQRGLGVSQMLNFFEETPEGWRAGDKLRTTARFEVHNLLEPPPHPGQFDLILCRNVLLYFDGPTRRRAFDRLSSALTDDGYLLLGSGESALGQTDAFAAEKPGTGFYRKTGRLSAAAPSAQTGQASGRWAS
jgi:chemotaxis protein methyltransferase CheR